MDESLLRHFNMVMAPRDTLWILGDLAWRDPREWLGRLRCRRVYVLLGDHDRWLKKWEGLGDKVYIADPIVKLEYKGTSLVLCHWPMLSWPASHYGSIHAYGHTHGLGDHPKVEAVDVGVDAWGYEPVSFEALTEYVERRRG